MNTFVRNMLVLGGAAWASQMLVDRFVLKSDADDPSGLVLQADGFGMDDVVTLLVSGAVGATALKWIR